MERFIQLFEINKDEHIPELIWRELILFQNSGRRISYSVEGTITGEDETEDIEEVDEENEDDMIYEDVPSSHQ